MSAAAAPEGARSQPVTELFALTLAFLLKETRSDAEIELVHGRATAPSNFLSVA